ncbi:MAG TPA: hypothetical protein VEZ55_06930 [Chitinophagaceae bacterium]|nr:hypothetical protein [Chitinophagaceae bacterium]
MIDVTKIVSEFNQADLQAYIEEYTMGDLQFKNYFPSVYTPNLTFEALEAQFSAKVAADVVAFDSRAPRKGRQTPGKRSGDIPKVEVARVKKESDLNVYRQLQAAFNAANNDGTRVQIAKRLIDWMYEDSSFVLDSVNARMEWLAKRIASTGKYSLTVTNNEGGVQTKVDVDFGIPGANVTNASVDWDSTATAKPVTDIRAKQTAARAKGLRLQYAFTDAATFDRMVATEEMQKFTASYVSNALGLQMQPNLDSVNTALRAAGLPTFIIWDSYVNVESKAGVHVTTTGWEDGNVTFAATNILGATQYTTTADGFVNIDDSVKVNNDFVLVKAYALQDPISVVTKGVAYATPVLNGANSLFILKTQL